MVGRIARKHLLQFSHTGGNSVEVFGALQILKEYISSVGSFSSVESVVDCLDRADYEVHLTVVHLKPSLVTVIIIVCLKSLNHLKQIVADTFLYCNVSSLFEILFNLSDLLRISIMVPFCLKAAVPGSLDECVWTVFERIVP